MFSAVRRLAGAAALFLLGAAPQAAPPAAATPAEDYTKRIQPLLGKYCYKCHGPQLKPKADLNMAKFGSEASIRENRKIWKEILAKTYTREMPPEDFQPQPTAEERDAITRFVEQALERVDPNAPKVAGRVVARRLNRAEYRHTVRDLLGVDFNPVGDFPADDVGYGFDNIGDVLSLPPLLMEKYMAASRKIADQAVAGKDKDRLVFTVKPDGKRPNKDVAKELLGGLALRAFRRPPQADELDRLVKLYEAGEKLEGGDFEKSMRLPIRGLLVSPHFLFRVEPEGFGAGDAYALSPWELATRLSYFLWSSMPDDVLFDLARSGKLSNPQTLEQQVVRMLKDPRAVSLAEQFAPQWLQVRRLDDMKFDAGRFPQWNDELRRSMVQEVTLFFDAVRQEDLSVLTFLDSDFTFVNAPLARLYGLPGGGSGFQRVKLSDAKRGGILTMGAVLAATSDPDRTSLVKRGKWILETILATPPPPPVPDAANLKEDPESLRLPLRVRMEKHRADPNCASCHKRMDPIGFGFENYDAIGAWRDSDAGKPVDSAAELPDGKKFSGPVELKKLLKEKKGEFVEGFSEKLLTYALGRGVEHYDGPAVKSVVDATAKKGYAFSALVTEIVKSYPFQYRQKDRGKR
jgi:mono/diheme cytochrome c family protein